MLDRDRIVEATDLGALADELLGPHRGTARSPAWTCPSPQHAQTGRTPPVSVFRSAGGEERWHCHGCGIGGSAVDLVMAAKGATVREAIEELGRRVGVGEPYVAGRPRPPRRPPPMRASGDLEGLATYVDDCARRLWQPAGRPVLRWLTEVRGLPQEVLAKNRIGADPGRRRQDRPDGMPSTGWAAVLPVLEDGRPVFAQLRALHPLPDRPRYLNAASRLATNPRLGFYEPVVAVSRCVVVTEGVIDALSATAAGHRSAAVLGASLASSETKPVAEDTVSQLARTGATLILAFDSDDAGTRAAMSLGRRLHEDGTRMAILHVPPAVKDLNGWMKHSRDWPRAMASGVRTAVSVAPGPRCLSR